jgi:hypothetical protein
MPSKIFARAGWSAEPSWFHRRTRECGRVDDHRFIEGSWNMSKASMADAVDKVCGRRGFMSPDIGPILPGRMAGPAVTVLEVPSLMAKPSLHALEAIDEADPGTIVVIGIEDPVAGREAAVPGRPHEHRRAGARCGRSSPRQWAGMRYRLPARDPGDGGPPWLPRPSGFAPPRGRPRGRMPDHGQSGGRRRRPRSLAHHGFGQTGFLTLGRRHYPGAVASK